MTIPTALALGLIQGGFVLLVAPLLFGVTRAVKARLQFRRGPGLLQPYRDLAKWWGKEVVESDQATMLTAAAPLLGFGATFVAILVVPVIAQRPPLDGWADLLVVIGLLALGRFVLVLAALDAGSAFGGMASSREVAIASLVEPALVLALAGAALAAGSTDLGMISRAAVAAGSGWYTPAILLAAAAFAIVAVAETGHEPIDNPDTHLEVTMIHEGMLLEASGPRLAILMYTAQLKLVLIAGLGAAVFLPVGAASELTAGALAMALVAALAKLVVAVIVLGILDAVLPKLRILALPGLLGTASILAGAGLATRIWLVG
jgi:formate hydrogenlyase subunit 4